MAMGAVRLFRVYLVGKLSFLFRQLGRGKKLRDRCNLLDLLCRTRLLEKAIYFLLFFFIHLLFSSIIPPISFDILRTPTRISQPKPYLKLASARSEDNVN
jgi:hypothetical protein